MARKLSSPEALFWARVEVVPDGCWLWRGSLDPQGYGRVRVGGRKGRSWFAHRLSYELFVGPIPADLQLDHLCRVHNCVRPEHLEAVTGQVNVLRGDTFVAKKSAQTHCIHGHEFTPENTYVYSKRGTNGVRHCRECHRRIRREWQRASRQRQREARHAATTESRVHEEKASRIPG